jgi:hypothetical protein
MQTKNCLGLELLALLEQKFAKDKAFYFKSIVYVNLL